MEQKAGTHHQGVVLYNRVGIQVKEHIALKRSDAVQEHGAVDCLYTDTRAIRPRVFTIGDVVNAVLIRVFSNILIIQLVAVCKTSKPILGFFDSVYLFISHRDSLLKQS